MFAVNYGDAGSKTADIGVSTLTLEAIAVSQMQRAEREALQHEHPVPREFTQQGDYEVEPFGGW
jgi:hypothetical protein